MEDRPDKNDSEELGKELMQLLQEANTKSVRLERVGTYAVNRDVMYCHC